MKKAIQFFPKKLMSSDKLDARKKFLTQKVAAPDLFSVTK